MKTKLKKLAVVWLAIIMLMSCLPLQAAAAQVYVYVSLVDTELVQYQVLNPSEGEAEGADVDTDRSLLEQLENDIQAPSGKSIVGWNVWGAGVDCGGIAVYEKVGTKDADGVLSEDEYNNIGYSDVLLEPVFGYANSSNGGVTNVLLILMKYCYINIDLNNGEGAQRVKVERRAQLDIDDPVREGYVFDGWYTNADCTEEFDSESLITSGISLWAKWTEAADTAEDVELPGVETEEVSE